MWAPLRKLFCTLNIHTFKRSPVVASLNTYWVQGGTECIYCRKQKISFDEARKLITLSYARGRQEEHTHMVAYGQGIDDIVSLYGVEFVQKKLLKYNQEK